MHIRRLFRYALVPALAMGLAIQGATSALADEEAETTSKKVRIRIARPKVLHPETKAHVQRSPASAVLHWAMKEMGAGEGHGADTKKTLTQWFDGGADVPMSGLRDALKSDGWNANSLIHWMHQEGSQLTAMAPMVMQMLGQHGGQAQGLAMGPMHGNANSTRTWHMQGPMPGMGPGAMGLHGGQSHGACPQCGQAGHGQGARGWGMGRRGMRQRRMGRQGGMRRWGMRRQGMRQRGMGPGMGHGQSGPQGPHGFHGGMGHGPQHMQSSRTIILWNDGSGWHRQALPAGPANGGGAAHGQHMPTWLGQMLQGGQFPGGPMGRGRMIPGQIGHGHMHGGMPHGGQVIRGPGARPHQHGPHIQDGVQWQKMLERMQRAQPEMSPEDLQRMIETLNKQLQSLEGNDAAPRRMPQVGEMKQKLESVEGLLKGLGADGAPGGMKFEDLEKLLKGLGASVKDLGIKDLGGSDRKVHIRIVKPRDSREEIEVIEEEAIKEVQKDK